MNEQESKIHKAITQGLKKPYVVIPLFILVCLLIFVGVRSEEKKDGGNVTNDTITTLKYEMPVLKLALSYFSTDKITWGSVNTSRDSNDPTTWKEAAVDDGYRSFPSTEITLSPEDYEQSNESLPPIKKIDCLNTDDGKILCSEQVKEYGDLVSRFWDDGYYITGYKKFDVDGDGKSEEIISLCGIGGNHCPHEIQIVKNGRVIFVVSSGLTGLGIEKTSTGNGFYVHWVPFKGDKWNTALCCPSGYMSTRFVFEDQKFKPIYEQENLYFKVENTH